MPFLGCIVSDGFFLLHPETLHNDNIYDLVYKFTYQKKILKIDIRNFEGIRFKTKKLLFLHIRPRPPKKLSLYAPRLSSGLIYIINDSNIDNPKLLP